MPESLSLKALNRATLARQHLLTRSDMPVMSMLEAFCGMQAQAPFAPYYGLWCRLEQFMPDELSDLLLTRQAVRLGLMRGTVHLITAEDAWCIYPLMQPIAENDLRNNPINMDLTTLIDFGRELLKEQALSLQELRPLLQTKFPNQDSNVLARALRNVLPLVQIPPRAIWGKSAQTRFRTLEHWLGAPLEPDYSLEQLTRRYLAAFGPASIADLQTWCGLNRMRETVEKLRSELVVFHDEQQRELFDLPEAPRPSAEIPAPVRLLPQFDNLLLSHQNRTRVMNQEHQKRLFDVKNGVYPATIMIDGFLAGTWSLEVSKNTAKLRLEPYRKVSRLEAEEMQAEAERLLLLSVPKTVTREVELVNIA
jgi:Winged helix DNA-binding domain